MTIKIGDRLPEATFMTPGADGPRPVTTAEYFGGRTIVLFAVPGAFTPTCHANHLPGYVQHGEAIKAKGVDAIAVTGVNDVFVMKAWAAASGATDKIDFLADGSAAFAKAIGMDLDLNERGLGMRSKRYSMLVKDGVVTEFAVEETPGTAAVSGAEAMLGKL
ncbi:MAG: peroxiredoxin [Methylocystis sp.]|jgi:peroxiredoxin|nr:peroxiredoxin [Methylocystis sp.]MCA3583662.1 peroxiredoxin [Methylocystis sp.]MCA3587862.1 peroxiredoxin [Methylocystis sp.]MCA3593144.1 peroxiredoxin [Methylocystis sp.]